MNASGMGLSLTFMKIASDEMLEGEYAAVPALETLLLHVNGCATSNEEFLSFESGVLQIRRESNKIDKNEIFLNKEFSNSKVVKASESDTTIQDTMEEYEDVER